MNKILFYSLIASTAILMSLPKYSTTSVVTIVGGIVATTHKDIEVKKQKRKDCTVCKGKGWYLSGDGIAKINCQYCEP
jgi:hypothetical protein